MPLEYFGVNTYGAGDIKHASAVRAGDWVFATGLRATDARGLIDPAVIGENRPLDPPPRPQREAALIFKKAGEFLTAAGSSLAHVARVDQYYPHWSAVDPYHVARKQALGEAVPPSTSILVSRLLNLDAQMDVQMMAATAGSGRKPERITVRDVGAPTESGYATCTQVGDFIFVAGQLARDESGAIAAAAKVPDGQLWKGTRIKRETDYLIKHRLMPALTAGGSSFDLILKAQVYLSRVEDFPAFWQVWSAAFKGKVAPTLIVPVRHPGFGTEEATIEVNIIAAKASAASRVRDIDCDIDLIGPNMLAARAFDGLLFVAGLMGIDRNGLVPGARGDATAPFYHCPAHAQMADILHKARTIFAAAGSDLGHVVRALHFHRDLGDFHNAHRAWADVVGDGPLPFTAIEVDDRLFVPGTSVIVDLWGALPD
ncbi:MAG: RidA family protein [Variibacter sp.]